MTYSGSVQDIIGILNFTYWDIIGLVGDIMGSKAGYLVGSGVWDVLREFFELFG